MINYNTTFLKLKIVVDLWERWMRSRNISLFLSQSHCLFHFNTVSLRCFCFPIQSLSPTSLSLPLCLFLSCSLSVSVFFSLVFSLFLCLFLSFSLSSSLSLSLSVSLSCSLSPSLSVSLSLCLSISCSFSPSLCLPLSLSFSLLLSLSLSEPFLGHICLLSLSFKAFVTNTEEHCRC